jgi:hypothetical protein
MSRSRRGNNRNRNGNNSNQGNGGGRNGSGTNAASDPRDFWGTTTPAGEVEAPAIETPDPTAMVRSLGIPPLAGHRPVSEHYFTAVYGKAAGLANALLATEQPAIEADDLVTG